MANAVSSASSPRAGRSSSSSSLPPPAAALPEELIEQILLRFPPSEPASLFRAALVCKCWCRLVSGPGFRRRFREFHRTPPMLGMICSRSFISAPHLVPTTAFRPHHAERGYGRALDARHGRVLLDGKDRGLIVWDPITDDEWKVPLPPQCVGAFCWTAAVLCSAAAGAGGCDHFDCHRQPFVVVFVTSVFVGPVAADTSIYTYSSNAAAWSEPICGQRPGYYVTLWMRSALVGNMLYFGKMSTPTALKYNMQLRQMSWIQLPLSSPFYRSLVLTATEDGGLWLAAERENNLYIWSTKDADEVDARWEQNRVIKLDTMLPVGANFTSLVVVGSMDDLSTIFVSVDDAAYAITLMTCMVKKVYEGRIKNIIPYMSFYTPALEADGTGEGPSAAGSSA